MRVNPFPEFPATTFFYLKQCSSISEFGQLLIIYISVNNHTVSLRPGECIILLHQITSGQLQIKSQITINRYQAWIKRCEPTQPFFKLIPVLYFYLLLIKNSTLGCN